MYRRVPYRMHASLRCNSRHQLIASCPNYAVAVPVTVTLCHQVSPIVESSPPRGLSVSWTTESRELRGHLFVGYLVGIMVTGVGVPTIRLFLFRCLWKVAYFATQEDHSPRREGERDIAKRCPICRAAHGTGKPMTIDSACADGSAESRWLVFVVVQ